MFEWLKPLCWLCLLNVQVLQAQTLPNDLQPVGQARLSVLWFDVYDATLLSQTGDYQEGVAPLVLRLRYLRNISRDRLLTETREQLKSYVPKAELRRWLLSLSQIWPDIQAQDELVFYLENENSGYFYHNGKNIGRVDWPGFAREFIDIWLADDRAYPRQAKQLRGGR